MNNTHVVLIVDKSGSMARLTDDTIGGFNSYLDGLEGEPKVNTLLFDTDFKVLFRDKTPDKATRLNKKNYKASGYTALYDAVGKTLEELEFSKKDKILCVIITDGEENSSTEFSASQVKSLISKKEDEGWDFMFIGADSNSWSNAGAMGVRGAYTYATHILFGVDEHMKWTGLTNATNQYQLSVTRGDKSPILSASAAYVSSTAPITTPWITRDDAHVFLSEHGPSGVVAAVGDVDCRR